jgi:diguanylate cyclase (GGDEF)-like protein
MRASRARPFDQRHSAMSNQVLLLILGGCILGAVQLLAGLVLGMWLRRGDSDEAQRGRQDMLRASLIAKRLQTLADEMSSSAHAHRTQLDQASQLLESGSNRSEDALAELVVDVIDNIVHANHDLQSQLTTAEDRLKKQATEIETHISRSLTDPLTGLPNRREFNERLEERMSAWRRRQEAFSLLILDVDHFKKLNDERGHLAGDQMLSAIARALRSAVRREDFVARYGGEEFAILLPNTTLEQAKSVAEKVRESVSRTVVEHNGQKLSTTVSGGLAAIAADDSADILIERADTAMYAAKASGRNRTCVHDGSNAGDVGSSGPRWAELIERSDAIGTAGEANVTALDFGVYLPRDEISSELAQTCDELRRYVEERARRQDNPDAAART